MITRSSVVLVLALALQPTLAAAFPVAQFVETVDTDFQRFRVSDAEGVNLTAAKNAAMGEALFFAAKSLTGSEDEKAAIEQRRATIVRYTDLARAGRVLKTIFRGDSPVVDILVDVNVKELRRKLEQDGTIVKQAALAESVGAPQILVVPEGYDPSKKIDPAKQFLTDRIASFLTQRKFDMVDANALKNVNDIVSAVHAIDGVVADPIAEVASVVGADIYFTYTAGITANVQASASVKAYEATTGRLLATGTGQSRQYPAGTSEMSALTEAVSDAMPKVFEDVSGYWHEDAAKGRKYMFSVTGDFAQRDKQKALKKSLEGLGDVKMSVKTANKMAGVIRSKKSADDVEDAIEDAIKDAGFANPSLTMSSRALFIFKAQ
jgi:Family of unknown function (DUF6175)